MRGAILALVCLAAAGCGGHGPSATSRAETAPPPVRVSLTAETHTPQVGTKWSYSVRVTDEHGRPLAARVQLQVVFGGAAVGQVGVHRIRGIWKETLGTPGNPPWPARSRGLPLTFQALVTARGRTLKRNWWIRVR